MKKYLILIACLGAIVILNAQFAVTGGMCFPSYEGDRYKGKLSYNLSLSYHLYMGNFVVEPGVMYGNQRKEREDRWDGHRSKYEDSRNMLGPFAKTKIEIDLGNFSLQPFAGLSVRMVTGGKWKRSGYRNGSGSYSKYDTFRDVYYGISFGVDAIIQDRYIVGVEYSNDVSSTGCCCSSAPNTLSFNIGYLFSTGSSTPKERTSPSDWW